MNKKNFIQIYNKVKHYKYHVLFASLILLFILFPIGPWGINDPDLTGKDSLAGYTCAGETKLLRKCMPGYKQACVNDIPCECKDGWKFVASVVDGCVKWSGKDIPKNAKRYAFPDECNQVCRGSGSVRAQ